MSDNKAMSSRSVLQDIVKWSAGLPFWQRDALRRIYQEGKLTEDDLNDLYRICKNMFLTDTNGKEACKAEPVEITHVPSESDSSKTVSLKCIKDVQHVNALVSEQKLSFQKEGLTIIFGNNGSGKSGYVRILKKACRSRYIEDILPNIYETTTGHATATIQYAIGGRDQSPFRWEDTQHSNEILSQISVFDSKCAPIHVEGLNKLAYTPLPLEILSELAKACIAIRKKLKDDENKLANEIPTGLRSPKYHNGTKVAQLIQSISADTKIDYVESVSKLSEEEHKRISTLRNDLANNPSKLSKQLELRKNCLVGVQALLTRLEDLLSDTSLNEYNTDFHTDKIPLNYETAHGRKMSFRLSSQGIAVS